MDLANAPTLWTVDPETRQRDPVWAHIDLDPTYATDDGWTVLASDVSTQDELHIGDRLMAVAYHDHLFQCLVQVVKIDPTLHIGPATVEAVYYLRHVADVAPGVFGSQPSDEPP